MRRCECVAQPDALPVPVGRDDDAVAGQQREIVDDRSVFGVEADVVAQQCRCSGMPTSSASSGSRVTGEMVSVRWLTETSTSARSE